MVWTQLKLLLPSYVGYWLFLTALLSLTWYGATRIYSQIKFSWKFPTLLATAMVAYSVAGGILGYFQNAALTKYQQTMQAQQQGTASEKAVDPVLQMRADFLKNIEGLVSNPAQITTETKNKLFFDFAKLFPNGDRDKDEYRKAVTAVFECRRYFWEDALASYKAKKVIKGDARKACETLSGAFFNREKLITAATIKNDDASISDLAAHKRMPSSDGKTTEVHEDMLRAALDGAINTVDAAKKIFE